MNSISWFLYLADVIQNLGVVFFTCAIGMSIVLGMGSMFYVMEHEEFWAKGWKMFSVPIIVCALFAAVVPSKNTMYAIAASEVGERVVKSEAVQGIADDATKALRSWIQQQIDTPKK